MFSGTKVPLASPAAPSCTSPMLHGHWAWLSLRWLLPLTRLLALPRLPNEALCAPVVDPSAHSRYFWVKSRSKLVLHSICWVGTDKDLHKQKGALDGVRSTSTPEGSQSHTCPLSWTLGGIPPQCLLLLHSSFSRLLSGDCQWSICTCSSLRSQLWVPCPLCECRGCLTRTACPLTKAQEAAGFPHGPDSQAGEALGRDGNVWDHMAA